MYKYQSTSHFLILTCASLGLYGTLFHTAYEKGHLPTLVIMNCVLLQLCVVMFFCDGLSHERARTFIRQMEADHVSQR